MLEAYRVWVLKRTVLQRLKEASKTRCVMIHDDCGWPELREERFRALILRALSGHPKIAAAYMSYYEGPSLMVRGYVDKVTREGNCFACDHAYIETDRCESCGMNQRTGQHPFDARPASKLIEFGDSPRYWKRLSQRQKPEQSK